MSSLSYYNDLKNYLNLSFFLSFPLFQAACSLPYLYILLTSQAYLKKIKLLYSFLRKALLPLSWMNAFVWRVRRQAVAVSGIHNTWLSAFLSHCAFSCLEQDQYHHIFQQQCMKVPGKAVLWMIK